MSEMVNSPKLAYKLHTYMESILQDSQAWESRKTSELT